MGAPDMAPQTPQPSARPGAAVTRLDHALLDGPRNGPQTPERSKRPGIAGPLLCKRALRWGPEMARSVNVGGLDVPPTPPNARGTPGNPGRPAIPVAVLDEASVMLAA